jgi:hypothetical protein
MLQGDVLRGACLVISYRLSAISYRLSAISPDLKALAEGVSLGFNVGARRQEKTNLK